MRSEVQILSPRPNSATLPLSSTIAGRAASSPRPIASALSSYSMHMWSGSRFASETNTGKPLDWLNAHTSEGIDFFGVELELLQIDDSPFAPHFKVVAPAE